MDAGIRPPHSEEHGAWTVKEFSAALGVNEKSIRNWLDGDPISPQNRKGIERVLFGGDHTFGIEDRRALRESYARGRVIESENGPPSETSRPSGPSSLNPPNIDDKALCLGRDEDILSLIAALVPSANGGSALVLGGPGFGKTTLTEKVALHPTMIGQFKHRRWFVKLAAVETATGIVEAIAAAIGLEKAAREDAVLLRLGEAPALLVLDNLETPWHRDRDATEALLRRLRAEPAIALIASLRSDDTMGDMWDKWLKLTVLDRDTARRAFRTTANRDYPDGEDLDFFLDRTGCIPLGIYLTAKRAAVYPTLERPRKEWQSMGLKAATARGKEGTREGDLAACIAFSLSAPTLRVAGRRLFALLGQLPAGLALDDQYALLQQDAAEADNQLRLVGLLEERDGRIDLLPPIRDVARMKDNAPSEQDTALWVSYYMAIARDDGARVGKADSAEAVARLNLELPNIAAAMLHAASEPLRRPEAVAVLDGLSRAMRYTGATADTLFEALGAACFRDGDPHGEAACLIARAETARMRSDNENARCWFDAARTRLRDAPHDEREADCLRGLAGIERMQGRYDEARALYQDARQRYQRAGNLTGEANCLLGLAAIERMQDRNDEARALYQDARQRYQRAGNLTGEANCLVGLAGIERMQNRNDEARALYQDARQRYQRAGALTGEADCLWGLAGIERMQNRNNEARALYQDARQRHQHAGNLTGEADCLVGLAEIERMQGP